VDRWKEFYASEGAKRSTVAKRGTFTKPVPILKFDDQRIITGIVMEPGSTDTQGDQVSLPEVEKAMFSWAEGQKAIGLQHQSIITDAITVLENWIAREDSTINGQAVVKGSWLMSLRVNDDSLWAAVKSGAISGFSIGGTATRSATA
jgi:DNA adenine methylase